MTLPLSITISFQSMWMVNGRQHTVTLQQLDNRSELIHRITTLDATFEILLKLGGSSNFIHQIPIALKNSSLFS